MATREALTPQPPGNRTPTRTAMRQREPGRLREGATTFRRALADSGRLSQAKEKIERRLAADPADAEARRRLGELQRRLGDIDAATQTFRKLKRQHDDAAAWRIAALSGEPLPKRPCGLHPAPFVRIPDFLTAAQRRVLLAAVQAGPSSFSPAQVATDGTVDLGKRTALVAKRPLRVATRAWFIEALRHVVGPVVRHLGIEDLHDYHVQMDLTAYGSGGFYRTHRDNDPRRGGCQLSFAYYCHREPKRFAGGDLLLYDTCFATDSYHAAAFSRLAPVHNSVVFFPAGYYHEVLPVCCESDAFDDARFTVNGWLHRASEWEATAEYSRRQRMSAAARTALPTRPLERT